jgi:hypothetical protein
MKRKTAAEDSFGSISLIIHRFEIPVISKLSEH